MALIANDQFVHLDWLDLQVTCFLKKEVTFQPPATQRLKINWSFISRAGFEAHSRSNFYRIVATIICRINAVSSGACMATIYVLELLFLSRDNM